VHLLGLLAEVAVQQTFESLAVAGFVNLYGAANSMFGN
jgi:hypothetical protein